MVNIRRALTLTALLASAACSEGPKREPQMHIPKAATSNAAEEQMMVAYDGIGTVETKFSYNGQVLPGVLSVSTYEENPPGLWKNVAGEDHWGELQYVNVEIRIPQANGYLQRTKAVIDYDSNSEHGVSFYLVDACIGQNNTCERIDANSPHGITRELLERAGNNARDALVGRFDKKRNEMKEVVSAVLYVNQ